MPDLFILCEKVADECSLLQSKIALKEWSEMQPLAFAHNLKYVLDALEEMASWLQQIEEELTSTGTAGKLNVKELLDKYNKEIAILKQNLKMEQERVEKIHQGKIDEEITSPAEELYSSLESKVLALILETRYLTDRLNIHLRKETAVSTPREAYKHVLKLLEEKEKEIHELRNKYSELRELGFLSAEIGTKNVELERQLSELEKKIEKEIGNRDVKEFIKLSNKLIDSLKKERDFSSKIALGMENEIAQMRSTYSRELLGIEEMKKNVVAEAERNAEKKLEKLKKELAKTDELLNHYKRLICERDSIIEELKERKHHMLHSSTFANRHLRKKDTHAKHL